MDKRDATEITNMLKGIAWHGLRPWSQFFAVTSFKAPPTAWSRFEKQVAANSVYFASNYLWVILVFALVLLSSSIGLLVVSLVSIAIFLVALRPPAKAQQLIRQAVAATGMKFLTHESVLEKALLYSAACVVTLMLVLVGGLVYAMLTWGGGVLLVVAHAATRDLPEGVEQVKLRFKYAPSLGSWFRTLGPSSSAGSTPGVHKGGSGGGQLPRGTPSGPRAGPAGPIAPGTHVGAPMTSMTGQADVSHGHGHMVTHDVPGAAHPGFGLTEAQAEAGAVDGAFVGGGDGSMGADPSGLRTRGTGQH